MTSVTPVFDELAVQWTEEGLPLPFKLVVIPEISPLGEQAELDEKLGTLPLWASWESSFHGEYLDFGESGPHRVLHERSDDRQDDEDEDVVLPSGDFSTDALAELEEGLAYDLADGAIIYLLDASEVNFDSLSVDERVEAWDEVTAQLAEQMGDEPSVRQVRSVLESQRLAYLEDQMKERAKARNKSAPKKPPSLIKKAAGK